MLTDVDVAANVLVMLLRGGVLAKGDMPRAMRLTGVSANHLLAAKDRATKGGSVMRPSAGPRLTGEQVQETATEPEPEPDPEQAVLDEIPEPETPPAPEASASRRRKQGEPPPPAQQRRERREVDGVTCLLCPRCDRWLPEETAFTMRSDRNARVTHCRECRANYHRERRVTTKVLHEMGAVGVRFVLDPDSNIVGLACSKCGDPFEPGDTVEGTLSPCHEVCRK